MRLIYHPHAGAELINAARYYENRITTLGAQFLEAADHAVATIVEAPERSRIVERDIRSFLMARFPYAIYYRALANRIHIRVQGPQQTP